MTKNILTRFVGKSKYRNKDWPVYSSRIGPFNVFSLYKDELCVKYREFYPRLLKHGYFAIPMIRNTSPEYYAKLVMKNWHKLKVRICISLKPRLRIKDRVNIVYYNHDVIPKTGITESHNYKLNRE